MYSDVERLVEEAKVDQGVLAVILFGSRARGETTPTSDIDVCLVLPLGQDTETDCLHMRTKYLRYDNLDLRIYQQLPLYVRQRVLKEGRVLSCRDDDMLYRIAYLTLQAFEDFKPIYHQYLEEVAHARS
jgi:hypothetical protein